MHTKAPGKPHNGSNIKQQQNERKTKKAENVSPHCHGSIFVPFKDGPFILRKATENGPDENGKMWINWIYPVFITLSHSCGWCRCGAYFDNNNNKKSISLTQMDAASTFD